MARRWVLAGLLLGGAVAGFWLLKPGAGPSRAGGLVLISIDTLRSDHLGCYGYPLPTSPAVDALSRDGVLFRNAISHAPSTLPSHASMLSSLLPQHHGASMALRTPLPQAVLTLTEVLRDAGYRTASFNAGGQISPEFGLDQGFETYDYRGGDFEEVVRKAIDWLAGHGAGPFFLFLHTYEVHHPYQPKEELLRLFAPEDYRGPLPEEISKDLLRKINRGDLDVSERDLAYIVAAYDAEIRSMDNAFRELVRYLQAEGLYDRTLVAFTSDHGEEFNEHGWVGWHSHTLYDELLKVPLILKLPGSRHAGRVVDAQVRLIDLAPTVLQALGIPAPPDFDGVGLLSMIEGSQKADLPAISMIDNPERNAASVRYRGWKWFRGRLYRLETDPGEQVDLMRQQGSVGRKLESYLHEIVSQRSPHRPEQVVPEAETLRRLRALGYVH